SKNIQIPLSWSPDGQLLLFREISARTSDDIWVLSQTGDRKATPWLQTDFVEDDARFSPNGHWVAYVSDQTGQSEVWVRPFQGPGSPIRVSSSGGFDPVWSRDGKELFYEMDGKLMSVEVTAQGSDLNVKQPRALFKGGFMPGRGGYDVSPDGRFLMI